MIMGSIRRKTQRLALKSSVIASALMCVCVIAYTSVMLNYILDANKQLIDSATAASRDALEFNSQNSILNLTTIKGALIDETIERIDSLVTMVSANADKILSNPEDYYLRDVDFPNPENAGKITAQLFLPEGVDREDLSYEIGLLANMSDVLTSVYALDKQISSVYVSTEDGISIFADIHSDMKSPVFDPRDRVWYNMAKEADKLIWTDIYSDYFGGGIAITCAMPFYNADGEFIGVAGADILLDELKDNVVNAILVFKILGRIGNAFIVDENGNMIISNSVFIDENGEVVSENFHDLLPSDVVERVKTTSGMEHFDIDGEKVLIFYTPLNSLPWSLVIVPEVGVVDLRANENEILITQMTKDAEALQVRIIFIAIAAFAGTFLLLLLVNYIMVRRFSANFAKPIIKLKEGAKIIGAGDLDYKLDVKTGDEIEVLANAFNKMIDNIKHITADKERIDTELDIATKIQTSMLQYIFPPFPSRTEFEIYASMQPAKEVGGDFYDFFLVDYNTLAVVVADVSGKGIPAALFMVITKTLIKNNALYGWSLEEVFGVANELLCENNDMGMFVTAFMGLLNLENGRFRFVNAGHNPPLIKRKGGEFDWLKTEPDFVLAGMYDTVYRQDEIVLKPGDELFLYTDGVTEAMNSDMDLFGEERLLNAANRRHCLSLERFTREIKRETDMFVGDAEQSDDMTMLALRFNGGMSQ